MTERRRHGQGSLYQRNGNWYGHWRSNGRQVKRKLGPIRQPGSKDGMTERMAEKALRELIVKTEAPPATGEPLSVGEVSRRYRAAAERKGRKRSTIMDYESHARVHLEPFFGAKSIASVTAEDVQDFVYTLEQKRLSPKTVKNIVSTLSALFVFAMLPRNRWASVNPCEGVDLDRGKPRSRDIRFLDRNELNALILHARPGPFQSVDRALYLTAAMTGMRRGELLALRWRDVDWPAARVRVRENFVRGEFGTPKSQRSFRSVPLADEVAGDLHRLWQETPFKNDDDLVFAHPHLGRPMTPANVTRRLKASLEAAGMDGRQYRFHDLRHTFGTMMASAGIPINTVREWMGHQSLATTSIYADYAESGDEAQMISRAFERTEEA